MCEFRDWRRLVRTSGQAWFLLLTAALAGAEDARTYMGHYRNAEYGFSIAIPGGRICRGVAAPAPAHGCRIAGGDDGAEVDVWGWYHTRDGGVSELLDDAVLALRRELGETAVVTRERFRLRGLAAVRATVRWTRDGEQGTGRVIFAIRRRPKSPLQIVYSIRGRCPERGGRGIARRCLRTSSGRSGCIRRSDPVGMGGWSWGP